MGPSRTVAGVVVSAAMIGACSGADSRRAAPTDDAGTPDATASGSGGRAGTGGRASTGGTSGTTATGGRSGSAGGAAGAHLDAGPDVSSDGGDGGPIPFVCRHAATSDGGNTVDAATGVNEWRDWASHTCAVCPAKAPVCDDLTGTRTFFDRSTRRLTLTVDAGVTEIVAGTVSISWDALLDDGGYTYGSASRPMTVTENTLTADFSAQIPAGVVSIYSISAELDDSCGLHSTVDPFFYASRDSDGGPSINITCEQ